MDPDQQQLRNLRDFLLVYNRMTEICFQRCTSNFNYRNLTMDEERCVDSCAGKLIRSNHRLMGTYVQLMPRMMQRRMDEMESKAAENAKAAEAAAAAAAAAANVGPPATEASPASEIPAISQISPLLTPPVTDAAPDALASFSKPAGFDVPVGLDAAVPKPTTATEVTLSAATALTPATEAMNPSVLNDAGSGPSFRAGFPPPPIAGAQIEFDSSAPAFTPSKPPSISADVPATAVAAPTLPKSIESLPVQERAQELPPPSSQQ
ncbi:mitochondrial import inner membrane translocase subunit Tim10 B [Sparus aurata]|uniref:Mitochondrial import inner membrane translocase subunit Tim10 B n=1 Tax=Sparus aurata TaxID=8175 RepID=A0A671VSV1_SPAAU|nr:mitochondrial import inner membrane translocase subunit Tim10 B [Sparus aurata]